MAEQVTAFRGALPSPVAIGQPPSEGGGRRFRLLVLEAQPLLLEGIRASLMMQETYRVVGESHDGHEALRQADGLRPDLALIDVDVPKVDGARIVPRLRELGIEVIALSEIEDGRAIIRMLRAGCRGYLCKRDATPAELLRALNAAHAGRNHVSESGLAALVGGATGPVRRARGLTRREREVLVRIAEGSSSREIGQQLGVSTRTVESHRYNMMRKLGCRRTSEMIQYVRQPGGTMTRPSG